MKNEFLFIRERGTEILGYAVILDDRGDFKIYEIPRRGNKKVRVTWNLLDESPYFDAVDRIVKRYREKETQGKLRKIGDSVW